LTTNPVSGAIDAVAEPLAILLILNDKADSGILVSPSPLPLKKDAPDTAVTTPEKYEPLFEVTTNPLSGLTDAVTLPLNILVESIDKLARVILLRNLPSPTKKEPVFTVTLPLTSIEPVNVEPFKTDSTLNPKSGFTDAVTLPLTILFGKNDNADSGISNRFLPLPLNDDPDEIDTDPDILKLPVNCEPTSFDITVNPKLGRYRCSYRSSCYFYCLCYLFC